MELVALEGSLKVIELQNDRMSWVGRVLEDHRAMELVGLGWVELSWKGPARSQNPRTGMTMVALNAFSRW